MITQVKFQIRCSIARDEEVVYILGDVPELGAWDQFRALQMTCNSRTTKDSNWSIDVFLPYQKTIEYKYILKNKGSITFWETITGNRTITPGVVNYALGKPCKQISTYVATSPPVPGARLPGSATNGNTNGYHEWLCCHTEKEKQPWWEVDLETEIPISGIALWNRQDRCVERLFPVWILISNKTFDDCTTLEESKANSTFSQRFNQLERTVKWIFDKDQKVSARYVRVQLENESYLHFAELEIFHEVDLFCNDAKRIYAIEDEGHPSYSVTARENYKVCKDLLNGADITHEVDDGLFGLDTRLHTDRTDLQLMVDSGWLTNETGSELRIILGSHAGRQSIHLLKPEKVSIEMRVEKDKHIHWPNTSAPHLIIASTNAQEDIHCGDEIEEKDDQDSIREHHRPMSFQLQNRPGRKRSCDLDGEQSIFSDRVSSTVLTKSNLRRISAFESLSDETLERIIQRMEQRHYKEGDVIIQKGEARKTLFIVDTGEVKVVGQSTLVGERALGALGPGMCFGEMALLAEGTRSANVKASSDVCCYALDRRAFIDTLGQKNYYHLVEEMIQRSTHVPISKVVARWDPSQALANVREEAETTHRITFDNDDIQVFSVRLKALEHLKSRIMLDIYSAEDPNDENNEDKAPNELLGTVYLLPGQLHRSNASLTAPIIAPHELHHKMKNPIVGQCLLQYMITNPLLHPNNNISSVWRNHWRTRDALDVGHRGLGRSYHQVEGYRSATIEENTLMSFIVAGQLGADYIEFDVQLTQDGVPVVYHDFFVEVGLEDNSDESKGEHYIVGIHDLTVRHLDRCRINPVQKKSFMFQRLLKKHWHKLVKNKTSKLNPSTKGNVNEYLGHLTNKFPRLRHVLEHVPQHIGLNIELKYPIQSYHAHLRDHERFEMNSYVDAILKCIFDHAENRRIIFSCFDADVCVMMRAKQARYPVFFLTCAGTDKQFLDSRCMSIESAIMLAKMEGFQGIVPNSEPFVNNPELISTIKKEGLLLFTWGDKNTDHKFVQFQKMHGVDAVISDNVGDLTKLDGKFLDFPENREK